MMGVRVFGIILATALVGGGFAATSGLAQVRQEQPVSALKGHNSNAPVDVSADRIEVQDRADRAVFTGNVHVTQAELTLDTPRLTVAYAGGQGDNNVQIKRLDAAGGVVVHSPSETAKGDFGVYDLDRKLITLIGNVQLNRENNQVNGARLVIDLDSGRAVIDGGPPGVNSSGGRVTGHFTVPQRQIAEPEDRPPVHRQLGDVLAVEEDAAAVRLHQAHDRIEAGRLAGAVRPEQADHLAAMHVERHVVKDRAPIIRLGD
jgi:lipopolysaccharide export system protein LptA